MVLKLLPLPRQWGRQQQQAGEEKGRDMLLSTEEKGEDYFKVVKRGKNSQTPMVQLGGGKEVGVQPVLQCRWLLLHPPLANPGSFSVEIYASS